MLWEKLYLHQFLKLCSGLEQAVVAIESYNIVALSENVNMMKRSTKEVEHIASSG
tara:strand:- start:8 stop:172 length:165 start_codon:yes stop_codon:yes gene_type:complete